MIEIKLTPVELAAVLLALGNSTNYPDVMEAIFKTGRGIQSALSGEQKLRDAMDAYKGKS